MTIWWPSNDHSMTICWSFITIQWSTDDYLMTTWETLNWHLNNKNFLATMEYDLYSKVKLSRLPDLDPSSSTFFFLFWGPYRHQTSVTYIRKEGFSNKDFLLRTTFDFSNLARCVLNCMYQIGTYLFEISYSNQLMKVKVELLDY